MIIFTILLILKNFLYQLNNFLQPSHIYRNTVLLTSIIIRLGWSLLSITAILTLYKIYDKRMESV